MAGRKKAWVSLLTGGEKWLLSGWLLLLGGLSFGCYLLFHNLAEQFCIFVAWGIAVLAFQTREGGKRRAAEAALRASEEKYRLLFAHSLDGIVLAHPDGSISAVNDAAWRIIGRTAEEIILSGRPGLIDLNAREIKPIVEMLHQEGKASGEVDYPRLDGTMLPLEFSLTSYTESDGRQVIPIIFNDISKRRATEGELRQTIALLERVKKIRGVGYWTLDLTNDDLFWSDQCRKIYTGDADFQLSLVAAQGLVHPDDFERMDLAVRKAIESRLPAQIQFRIIRPGGRQAMVDVDIVPDCGPKGEVERIFGTIIDVSWQWQAEKALLENAEKLLVLDQLKNTLLDYTSRELRIPLNAIIGISQALLETPREIQLWEQKEYLAIITSCGRRLANLIDDMGEAFRLWQGDAGKVQLQRGSLSLKAVVRPLLLGLELLNKNQAVFFRVEIPDDLPNVWADEDRLKQILHHLADNAYKYTPNGVITLTASLEGTMVRIAVSDSGTGVNPARAAEINCLFSRTGEPRLEQQSGPGFSLAICKYLVELHQGTISLEAGKSGGARFSFTLPACTEKAAAASPEKEPGARPVNGNDPLDLSRFSNHFGECILIVADDAANSLAIASILQLDGYAIITAVNHDQAVALINDLSQICLVIIDLTASEDDGNALCRSIRQKKDQYVLPVLMLKAGCRSDDLLASFAAGVSDFLTKPVELYNLRARVHTLIDLQKSFAQALKSEVKFLQSQIKPHFIHNALHTIISISRSDTEKARTLLVEFSNYLRGCFYFKNLEDWVPIQTEISLVKSYVAIEQARFGRSLQLEYIVESDRIMVPPLIIQPLVENAVVHGLRPKAAGGKITVEVKMHQQKVKIRISDDGVGMAAEKISDLLNASLHHDGVGLSNINQRLNRLFGSKLIIKSEENVGTEIRLELQDGRLHGQDNG